MNWSNLWKPRAPPPEREPPSALEVVRAYHRASKHQPQRYADGPGWLDWANQPAPFRSWTGAPRVALSEPPVADEADYDAVLRGLPRPARPPGPALLSDLLYDALSISAWKQAQDTRWALRVNPSSGNLHPTELYLALGTEWGLHEQPALWHYAPREHALERLATCDAAAWARACAACAPGTAVLLPASIAWREAWKYGLRAWRYCQHDLGHALAGLGLSAAARGWRIAEAHGAGLAALARAAGLVPSGPERERADLALVLAPAAGGPPDLGALEWTAGGARPNSLSNEHVDWPAIEALEQALDGAAPLPRADGTAPSWEPDWPARPRPFRALVRARRSAVDMDGRGRLSRADFERMLGATLPRSGHPAFAGLSGPSRAHLLLFVHRVDDLAPGLYFFARSTDAGTRLQRHARREFAWRRVEDARGLELVCLHEGDLRGLAAGLSCEQAIAANGAFAAGMLCEFDAALSESGARAYPRLYWECGALGQVLYLEAEAAGLRATGIGCYFDDGVHTVLGLGDTSFQSLYHFTVGSAVDDPRLTTLAAYPAPDAGSGADS